MNQQIDTNPNISSNTKILDLKTPLILNILEFLLIAFCVIGAAITFLFRNQQSIIIYAIAALVLLIFSILLTRKVSGTYTRSTKQVDNQKKARLYSFLFGDANRDESINIIRSRAIQYCQQLIDDYKDTRRNARTTYYFFQIATVILSGVTPILVVLKNRN